VALDLIWQVVVLPSYKNIRIVTTYYAEHREGNNSCCRKFEVLRSTSSYDDLVCPHSNRKGTVALMRTARTKFSISVIELRKLL
jgi:hypothetical protein